MESLSTARRLSDQGRFGDALDHLRHRGTRVNRVDADVLRVELLEKLGWVDQAQAAVEDLRTQRGLTAALRARCEYVVSRLCAHGSQHDRELQHLQRALGLANEGHDLEVACWTQLRLL